MTAPQSPAIVQVACKDQAEADAIASQLVEAGLAACVQSHTIKSTYAWQGKVEQSAEIMLTIKTRATLFPVLEAAVVELHSYDVPEIVMIEISAGHAPYLDWLATQTGGRAK